MGRFGNPINDANLSRRERAQKALDKMELIKEQAMRWVNHQKEPYGNGTSTLCMIYNATGYDVNLVGRHDWSGLGFHGGFEHNPVDHYPEVLRNGEIGVFLHVHEESKPTGSIGAIVYRGVNGTGDKYCDFMLAWYNSWNTTFNRAAYSEVCEMDHFKNDGVWGVINEKMKQSNLNQIDQNYGCKSMGAIGNVSSPFFLRIMTLEDVY